MIKKCIGCGVVMQSFDKEKLGYTPDLKNQYCMRCFRLKNYGEIKLNEEIDEEFILKKVNKSSGVALFLVDFFNINKYTLSLFKQIKISKVLVISKSDILRKDMKFKKIVLWLKKVYNIEDEVLFISNKNMSKKNIFSIIDKYNTKSCYVLGITNAGKSTFINSILKNNGIKKEIVTSNKPNTTLDFIRLRVGEYVIYDTPGFNLKSNMESKGKEIRPITLNIQAGVTLKLEEYMFYFDKPNIVVIYVDGGIVTREYKDIVLEGNILQVKDNQDIVIPGVGFINVKREAKVKSNTKIDELRLNVSGVEL